MQSPADFSKYNPNTRRQAEYFLQKYKDVFTWNDSENIIEVGCADGSITKEVLYPFVEGHLNQLLAVDVSTRAIEIATSTNKNSKITFQYMDIGNESDGDNYVDKFDKMFAFYCFHLVNPPESWSRNVKKMLKKNGQVFATVVLCPNINTYATDKQLANTNAPWNKYIQNRPAICTSYGSEPIEAITKILNDAGLVVNAINLEEVRNTFEDKEHLIKTIISYSFFVKYVPEELKEDYIADFVQNIFEHTKIDENGHHYFSLEVVSFVAMKP